MDHTQIKPKLDGSGDERAVSPVIGVILMVAITVILAAVIAAFVLDLGDSVGQEAQAGVNIDVDESSDEIQIEVTSLGNSDHVDITGDVRVEGADADDDIYFDTSDTDGLAWENDGTDVDAPEDALSELGVGDVVTIGSAEEANTDVRMGDNAEDDGTITVIAVIDEDDTQTQVGSEDYDLEWDGADS